MSVVSVVGAALMAALGLCVLLLNRRLQAGRPRHAVLAAWIRSAGVLLLAAAIVVAGADALFAGGLLMLAGVGVVVLSAVIAVSGDRRAGRRRAEQ